MPISCLRLLALVALVPLAGCPAPAEVDPGGLDLPGGATPAVRTPDLDAARARWEAAGFDAYTMTLRRICFCPTPDYTGPFTVRVQDGALASVSLDGVLVDEDRGETVDDLFDLIEDAYERKAEVVAAEFHPEYGYPTSLSIDYSSMMADEEIGYHISDLKATDR